MAKRIDPAKSKRTKRLDDLMKRADTVAENIREAIKNMNVDSDEFRSIVDENRRLSEECSILLADMPPLETRDKPEESAGPPLDPATVDE